jgi:hypothetical protein
MFVRQDAAYPDCSSPVFMTGSLVMTLFLVAAVAIAAGAWVARWWLLTLPLAMLGGAGLLLAMGSKINQDNPLLFLIVVLELGLAAGVVLRKRSPASALPAARR